ncbi:uncharacterized protein LOC144123861 [Amblyomma americanum]
MFASKVFLLGLLIAVGALAVVLAQRPTRVLHVDGPAALQERLRLAQCRATCLGELGLTTGSQDIECKGDKECYMCWEVCGLFYDNFTIWGRMCTAADVCFPGCQVACSFKRTNRTGIAAAEGPAEEELAGVFADPPRLEAADGDQAVRVTWQRPLGLGVAPTEPALVYLLLLRGVVHRDRWEEAAQTQYQNATLSRSQLKQASELEIVALAPYGPCARTRLTLEPEAIRPDEDILLSDAADRVDTCAAPRLLGLRHSAGHKVEAQVTWDCAHRSSDSKKVKFQVTWKILDNAVDVTGRLYTSRQSATLPLWRDTSYSIFVHRLSPWTGEPEAETQALLLDTLSAEPKASYQEAAIPWSCVSVQVVAGCAVALLAVFVVFVVGLALIARRQSTISNGHGSTGKSTRAHDGGLKRRSRRGSQLCNGAKALFGGGDGQPNGPSSPVGESREDLLAARRESEGHRFVYDSQVA